MLYYILPGDVYRKGRDFIAINKAMRAALKALSYPDITVEQTYKLERNLKAAIGKPRFYKTWDHVVKSGEYEVPVRIFTPESFGPHDVLIFFHGGGWVTGDIDSYTPVCKNMARITNRIVVSVDYRLAPEHRFPAAPEDCYAVAREIYLNSGLLPLATDNVALVGDSAGANLAAVVSLMARDRGEFLPTEQILLYPATYFDYSPASPFPSVIENGTDYLLTTKRINEYINLYKSCEKDLHNPYFAPLTATDFSKQPRTLILTAEFDPLRDEGEMYGQALQSAGNSVLVYRILDALHGFISLPPQFEHVQLAYAFINRFLRGSEPPVRTISTDKRYTFPLHPIPTAPPSGPLAQSDK